MHTVKKIEPFPQGFAAPECLLFQSGQDHMTPSQ
jgi:hypothetical protein